MIVLVSTDSTVVTYEAGCSLIRVRVRVVLVPSRSPTIVSTSSPLVTVNIVVGLISVRVLVLVVAPPLVV
jgi:hypothetical protein